MPKRKRKVPEKTPVEDEAYIAEANSKDDQEPTSEICEIPNGDKIISCHRYNGPDNTKNLIFTHGAGGALSTPAVVNFATGFATSKSALCFKGNMNLKSRVKFFHAVIEHEGVGEAIGGRSMGARAAVMTAHENEDVKVLILISYPLTNAKGDERDQILLDLRQNIDVLFMTGDRDTMCNHEALSEVRQKMKAKSWLVMCNGANHGMEMKPKKATDPIGKVTGEIAAAWVRKRDKSKTELVIGWDDENDVVTQYSWKRKTKAPS